ncbi:hypothetical protein V6R21_01645 [Limibacter armeniacum]|uniref:hypothetical protein n=1 Tax=Limibacter armeniacum TaxID=466084 RepID=UPI002FE5304C
MKSFLKFSKITLSAMVGGLLFLYSCSDQLVDDVAKGEVSAVQAEITLGENPDATGVSEISSDMTLTAGNTYVLNQFVRVLSGVTLTIQPGVTIKGKKGTLSGDPATGTPPGTLIIERGAKIKAEGTASSPIIFTSYEGAPAPGDWGGVVILGKAPVSNNDTDPQIEGVPEGTTGDNSYGGNKETDNSGVMQYVRIEYAGNTLTNGNETNGLTLAGVGNGTVIDHVQVSHGNDDGFEFFGGTVNAKYLISYRNRDDDFDTDQGYTGKIQYGIVLRDANRYVDFPANGFESNGDNDDASANFTDGTFANFTVIGPIKNDCSQGTVNAAYNSGAILRDASSLDVFNSVFMGFPNYQFELASDAGTNLQFDGNVLVVPNYAGAQGTNATSGFTVLTANTCDAAASPFTFAMSERAGLTANSWSFNDTFSVMPISGSTLNSGASWTNAKVSTDAFFDKVTFRGAMGYNAVQNWNFNSNWTSFN